MAFRIFSGCDSGADLFDEIPFRNLLHPHRLFDKQRLPGGQDDLRPRRPGHVFAFYFRDFIRPENDLLSEQRLAGENTVLEINGIKTGRIR